MPPPPPCKNGRAWNGVRNAEGHIPSGMALPASYEWTLWRACVGKNKERQGESNDQ